ncbi:NAD-dependent epimerase/dehydratase family protein [Streptomonospora nanhaiensis]|uniref:Nucleoside-diphosphate-sugar epimerase n=1 Tax=Streptomonospora nanhaiensis TaxID=1323731 RepID=A0A853BMH1_9ACTN|nr:NAD-dependent epimerase/dehydratase family protein [Streptomonospora nanhaiensis]MBV2365898.1 NAD-dependent epimerase/dehydratase family protein [Streptomonospora nanhaiensis]MBX9389015.1 NAD-dependent epimerase/dehydratase family protein [Streptomonospora nanhaiensis]NYI95786.1 nucleoside-diphosphate-sugar epimerase [Streptomonospora nanhaiensis]
MADTDASGAPRRSLVTGATGLLGGNIVAHLLDAGGEVVALVRDPERARRLLPDHDRLTVAAGDITDPGAYSPLLPGCDAVFHTAAYFREFYRPGADLEQMERVNVTAVGDLLRAAEAAGVPVFVHTSSINVLAATGPQRAADEDTGVPEHYRDLDRSVDYASSKVRAERVVRDYAATSAMRVPIVLPGWMWGPGDAGPTSAGRLLQSLATGRMRAVPALSNYAVDARDVAAACVRAAVLPVTGRFVVAGAKHTIREIAEVVAKETGTPVPRAVPAWLAMAVVTLMEVSARLRGTEPTATRTGVAVLRDAAGRNISSARAQRELGIVFRPIERTIADEVAWYRAQGVLPERDPASSPQ